MDVEILQGLIKAAKIGTVVATSPRHIIGVGHSYGSIIQLAHNAKYPNESAATVLTGYVQGLADLPTTVLANNPAIGYLVHPTPESVQIPFFRWPFFDKNSKSN